MARTILSRDVCNSYCAPASNVTRNRGVLRRRASPPFAYFLFIMMCTFCTSALCLLIKSPLLL